MFRNLAIKFILSLLMPSLTACRGSCFFIGPILTVCGAPPLVLFACLMRVFCEGSASIPVTPLPVLTGAGTTRGFFLDFFVLLLLFFGDGLFLDSSPSLVFATGGGKPFVFFHAIIFLESG